jgi:hypothetical protein
VFREASMGRLHSSRLGRAVLVTAAVALLLAEGVADADPLGALAARKRRSA